MAETLEKATDIGKTVIVAILLLVGTYYFGQCKGQTRCKELQEMWSAENQRLHEALDSVMAIRIDSLDIMAKLVSKSNEHVADLQKLVKLRPPIKVLPLDGDELTKSLIKVAETPPE